MEVSIDCPVCSTGNYVSNGSAGELRCRDCGFLLTNNVHSDGKQCVFCGNDRWFYYESPLSLSVFGRHSVCYVCEAQYKNVKVDDPEPGFDPESYDEAKRSSFAQDLKKRVEKYPGGPEISAQSDLPRQP